MTGCKLTRTSLPHPPPLSTPCPKLNPCSAVHAADSRPIAAAMGVPTARSMHHSAVRSIARTRSSHTWGGGVMTSFLLESPDEHYQTKPAIPDNDKAVTPFRRTNSFSLALVHTFRRHERGRAGACATRAGRKLIAQGGDQHMPARPQPGFNFILFTSHVPFLALPDGRVPAAAHTNSIQGWFPAGLPVTVTPWPAGAGLLSIGDRTIRLTRPLGSPALLVKAQQALRSSSPPNSRGLTASGGPIPAAAFAARARSSHAVHRCGALLSNFRPHPALGELCTCSELRLQVLPAVVSRSDFSRLCLSTPPPGACEPRVAPTRAAQRAGWGLVFSFQLAVEQKTNPCVVLCSV